MGFNLNLGLTLVELLVVVAIAAILASVGYPAYQSHVTKSRYADGKAKLLEITQLQRRYFTDNNAYTLNLKDELGYTDAIDGAVASENGFYLISAVLCRDEDDNVEPISNCVELSAAATFPDGGVNLTYNTRNEKGGPPKAW